MSPSCRCRTVILSGGDHGVVPLHAAFLTDLRHIPFADSAPHGRRRWCSGAGANGEVRCHLVCWPHTRDKFHSLAVRRTEELKALRVQVRRSEVDHFMLSSELRASQHRVPRPSRRGRCEVCVTGYPVAQRPEPGAIEWPSIQMNGEPFIFHPIRIDEYGNPCLVAVALDNYAVSDAEPIYV